MLLQIHALAGRALALLLEEMLELLDLPDFAAPLKMVSGQRDLWAHVSERWLILQVSERKAKGLQVPYLQAPALSTARARRVHLPQCVR